MIKNIAESNGLKVIYDAAASFGVEDEGGSILRHGDLSILSFHATKVFNTFEGGAVISPDLETKQHIDHLRNFGFANEESVVVEGINVADRPGTIDHQHLLGRGMKMRRPGSVGGVGIDVGPYEDGPATREGYRGSYICMRGHNDFVPGLERKHEAEALKRNEIG